MDDNNRNRFTPFKGGPMIPLKMKTLLEKVLPDTTWQNRLIKDGSFRYMEFGPLDVDRLQRLGIRVDRLGPRLLVCMWDNQSPLEIGGFLVVDNLAMGQPSMGGTRMLPDITPVLSARKPSPPKIGGP
jgi:glutamate dehydrogenase (NAD(P)+)